MRTIKLPLVLSALLLPSARAGPDRRGARCARGRAALRRPRPPRRRRPRPRRRRPRRRRTPPPRRRGRRPVAGAVARGAAGRRAGDVAGRAGAGGGRRAERGVEVRRDRLLPGADADVVGPGRPPTTSTIRRRSAPGTQLRTPPLVPDANYIDWRYTNSLVAPWTELNFHYGNDRVKATVQIASYNLTDPGYRRLESNLGINQAFITHAVAGAGRQRELAPDARRSAGSRTATARPAATTAASTRPTCSAARTSPARR